MNYRYEKQFNKNKKQKGFSLIELAVVGIFLGQLVIFAITTFSTSAPNSTIAKSLVDTTGKIASQWGALAQACNVSLDISAVAIGGSGVTGTARKNLALIVGSSSSGAGAAYSACYRRAGVKPLIGTMKGSAGAEALNGFSVASVANTVVGARNYVAIDYSGVQEHIVLALYNKYSSQTNASTATVVPASADTTDPLFRFSVASGNTRTVTILQSL